MKHNLQLKYPSKRETAFDSFKCMFHGFKFQLGFVSILHVLQLMFYGEYFLPEPFLFVICWAIYSSIVIFIAWLIVFMPIYFFHYKDEGYFTKKSRFVLKGALIGFFVSIGFFSIWNTWRESLGSMQMPHPILFSIPAAICGGIAAERGCLLREWALMKLNKGCWTSQP